MFDISIYTYKGLYENLQADKMTLETIDGQRTILSNRMPVMMILSPGKIKLTKGTENSELYLLTEGVLYFENNNAKILCDKITNFATIKEGEISDEERDILLAKMALAKSLKED